MNGLPFAVPFFRRDREVVLTAVSQNGYALEYAPPEYYDDRGIVLAAVANEGCALELVPRWHHDIDILRTAVNRDRRALRYVPRRLRLQFVRAGPIETRLLFKYMSYPFDLPSDVVDGHILPRCHRV